MSRVPKKNISGVLSDVKPPSAALTKNGLRISEPPKPKKMPALPAVTLVLAKAEKPPKRIHFGRALGLVALVAVLGLAAYGALLYREKGNVYASLGAATESFRESIRFLTELDPSAARRSLETANEELRGIRSVGEQYGILGAAEAGGKIWPTLERFPRAFRLVEQLAGSALSLATSAEELKANGVAHFVSGGGEKLLAELETLRTDTRKIRELSGELVALSNDLDQFVALPLPDNYLKWNTELLRTEELLDGALALLGSSYERRILLFFENPSEMRPAGGFIGSYADMSVARGEMRELDVRDIYDPDGQLDLKVIPPKPLQAITTSWGARDANWFFDFPTSARKVIGFLEASKMYAERRAAFEGAIAINTDVIETVLELTGPVELPEYELTLDAENFLEEVQKEVEAGESKRVGEPKRILRDIVPVLLARLAALDEAGKRALIERVASHLERGDIMFYFRDPALQNFFLAHGLAGAVADLPLPFYGDYLAVVNGNVAGGKTDIYMEQEVIVKSAVNLEGSVKTDTTVVRTHTGARAPYSWYRATNQNYLRLLVHPDVKLISLTGDTPKTVRAPVNYEKNGYDADPDVAMLDEGEMESGKKAIGAWLNVKAGAAGTLRASYENAARMPLEDGRKFAVVLERQAGVRGSVHYEVEAPPGYVWRETKDARYVYESADPPKRMTTTLTLKKL